MLGWWRGTSATARGSASPRGLEQQAVIAGRLLLSLEEVAQARERFMSGVTDNIEAITARSPRVRSRDAEIDARQESVGIEPVELPNDGQLDSTREPAIARSHAEHIDARANHRMRAREAHAHRVAACAECHGARRRYQPALQIVEFGA